MTSLFQDIPTSAELLEGRVPRGRVAGSVTATEIVEFFDREVRAKGSLPTLSDKSCQSAFAPIAGVCLPHRIHH